MIGTITKLDFKNESLDIINSFTELDNWPVVYLIANNEEIYVGETQNIGTRFSQHYQNEKRRRLKDFYIIYDKQFNKSAILDIEQNLIHLFSADNVYRLQNLNNGQSKYHNYYQKSLYLNKLDSIWVELSKHGVNIKDSVLTLQNNDIFKFSPYHALTSEQNDACNDIINDIINTLDQGRTGISVVKGEPGSGKTILLINLIYKLINGQNIEINDDDLDSDAFLNYDLNTLLALKSFSIAHNKLKIGYVSPMAALRETIGKVFKDIKCGLSKSLVIGPSEAIKSIDEPYDILIIDESHRLTTRKNIQNYKSFQDCAELLNLDYNKTNQLEMLLKSCKYAVLVYDENQSIKGSDISKDIFNELTKDAKIFELKSQLRCKGNKNYIKYVDDILNVRSVNKIEFDPNIFDFKIFDNVNELVNKIRTLDKQFGLSRVCAGYSWPWKSNGLSLLEAKKQNKYDIEIDNNKYIWNIKSDNFILDESGKETIGCVHRLQGYDLNYVGVIFGKEITFNKEKNIIEINRDNFYDINVKKSVNFETLKMYILNTYKILMTRGIKGCYIYCCDKNLQEYLKKYIDLYN